MRLTDSMFQLRDAAKVSFLTASRPNSTMWQQRRKEAVGSALELSADGRSLAYHV
jgi:hypothetical protein